MSFVRQIIEQSLPEWEACLNTPFVQELAAGTLPEDAFKGYLVDDTIYLREYAKVYAYAMYRTKSLADIRVYYSVLGFVQESEDAVRIKYLKSWGLDDAAVERLAPRPENQAYIDLMYQAVETGDERMILMAVLPCMFSYYWIAKELKKQYPQMEQGTYGPLLKAYLSEEYGKSCRKWAEFAEEKCAGASEEEKRQMEEFFHRASLCELDFWKMSYVPRTDC